MKRIIRIIVAMFRAAVWIVITYFMPGKGMGEIERNGENYEQDRRIQENSAKPQ